MNKLESLVYHVVRKNPALKQVVRNAYQGVFDLLPRKSEFFRSSVSFKEDYFFGFHDVSPFSFDETKVLANHCLFDLRMPKPSEGLEVGYFDLKDGQLGEYHLLGTSCAWNYHKGCRLQWVNADCVIFNTAENGRMVSKQIDLMTRKETSYDFPIDAIHTDSTHAWATSFSYERLERCMPGYGYPYLDGGCLQQEAPVETGLFLADLKNGSRKLLVSLEELSHYVDGSFSHGYLHFVTHSEFSKDARYISFLYRRIPLAGNYMKRYTLMMVYDLQSHQLIELPTQESGSHYVWNGRNQLIASCILNGKSCHALYDMQDLDHPRIVAGDRLNSDGHQSFISDSSFVTDIYPDKHRMAKIFRADIVTGKVELLVSTYSPKQFQTKDCKCHIACDLHPRVSPSGNYLCFDSPRSGKRALYVMPLK